MSTSAAMEQDGRKRSSELATEKEKKKQRSAPISKQDAVFHLFLHLCAGSEMHGLLFKDRQLADDKVRECLGFWNHLPKLPLPDLVKYVLLMESLNVDMDRLVRTFANSFQSHDDDCKTIFEQIKATVKTEAKVEAKKALTKAAKERKFVDLHTHLMGMGYFADATVPGSGSDATVPDSGFWYLQMKRLATEKPTAIFPDEALRKAFQNSDGELWAEVKLRLVANGIDEGCFVSGEYQNVRDLNPAEKVPGVLNKSLVELFEQRDHNEDAKKAFKFFQQGFEIGQRQESVLDNFTPKFYPNRFALKEALYEQDLDVLEQLVEYPKQ